MNLFEDAEDNDSMSSETAPKKAKKKKETPILRLIEDAFDSVDKIQHWYKDLAKDKDGRPKATMSNLMMALTLCPHLQGVFAYDEWRREVSVTRLPWGESGEKVPRELQDNDYFALRVYLERLDNFNAAYPKEVIADAIENVARLNPFNEVLDWLGALKWDGVPRLDKWLSRYLYAEDNDVNTFIGRKFLISSIARAIEPGCKADHVLVLEGEQGIGKSTVFSTLFGKWYLEGMPSPDDPHAAYKIQGWWLVESSELSSLGKSDARALKSFLTQKEDVYRPPYGRNFIKAPRRCVFGASTNEDNYLKDPTGSRRWWSVKTTSANLFDLKALSEDREQIFAEALVAYRSGEAWHPQTEAEKAMLKEVQDDRGEENIFSAKLAEWLNLPTTPKTFPLNAALAALGLEIGKANKVQQMQCSDALRYLGVVKIGREKFPGFDGRVSVYGKRGEK